MRGKSALLATLFTVMAASTTWSQTDYVITSFPIAAVSADSAVEIRWTGISRPGIPAPDSGIICYSRTPGGSVMRNYQNRVTRTIVSNNRISDNPPQRQIFFRPSQQQDMSAGVFYYIVAWPISGVDTLVSNELQMIVETDRATKLTAPSGSITSLTPTFSWEQNPGVPYYHLILSDEEIRIDSTGNTGAIDITGISIIWQAITSGTQIVYGAPDPSGTITASPPPLSPGKTYSVVILNNYGNHPAYTSTKVGLPNTFTVRGDTLAKPRNLQPAIGASVTSDSLVFRWTNLDTLANTYKVYIYMSSSLSGTGGNVAAQLVVWDGEVTAGTFRKNGRINPQDTGWLAINAKSILTKNHYTWKVIAVDSRGAGRAGDTTGFDYSSPTGIIQIETKEQIRAGGSVITNPVANAEIKVEVLDGSMEKPVLFYTDNNGVLYRDRPVGTYRVTAVKKGFDEVSRTLTVVDGQVTSTILYLKRPDATIFGRVTDESGLGLGLVSVVGVSDLGDTVRAETDQLGSFVLNCSQADWSVWAQRTGYQTSVPRKATVFYGQSVAFGDILLRKKALTLSGHVTNQNGARLIGVNVKLFRGTVLLGDVPSTPQDGSYSFTIDPGVYTIIATKTGFSTVNRTVELATSQQVTIVMQSGAALIVGSVVGRTRSSGRDFYAPIANARVDFVDLVNNELITAQADPTYGQFRANLLGGRSYRVQSSAAGFNTDSRLDTIQTSPGSTQTFNDTLTALARIRGTAYLVSKDTRAVVGPCDGVTVNAKDREGTVVSFGRSQPDGQFEVKGLMDGIYHLRAGKDGFYTDSIDPVDSFLVVDGTVQMAGQVNRDSVALFLMQGDKTIRWVVDGGKTSMATIKIRSPIQKTLPVDSVLREAGSGAYIVAVDAVPDSVINLSYHAFTVSPSDTVYVDSVFLPVTHVRSDTLSVVEDSITLVVKSERNIDQATLFYRDVGTPSFDSLTLSSGTSQYTFKVRPQRDGSTLLYYFRARIGRDVYGSSQKTYQSFVRPSRKLSKLSLLPAKDTMIVPSSVPLQIRFRAYYGSAFLLDSSLYQGQVSWKATDLQGCAFQDMGSHARLTTGSKATTTPVRIVATVPSSLVRSGTPNEVAIYVIVSGFSIDSLMVTRTDPLSPMPITTSLQSRAEFTSQARDRSGRSVTITPTWSVLPLEAGSITDMGVFRPNPLFAGRARIIAQAGGLTSEYLDPSGTPHDNKGVMVHHLVLRKNRPDTLTNFGGITVVLPDSVVPVGQSALLEISRISTENIVRKGIRTWKSIGDAFDVTERNNVALRVSRERPIMLSFRIPESEQSRAVNDNGRYRVARWNTDSLSWDTLSSSRMSQDGKSISAQTLGFSIYTVLANQSGLDAQLTVSPNPFSPFIVPTIRPGEEGKYGTRAHRGTCITFTIGSEYEFCEVLLSIYNVVGDLVWQVGKQDVTLGTHHVWWNGVSMERKKDIDEWNRSLGSHFDGGRVCRNGRYFVVLKIKDVQGREKKFMKPIVLIK